MIPTFVASFVAVAKVFIEWRPPTCTFQIASACSRGKSEHVWIYSLNLDIWDIRIVCKCQILTTSWVKSLCIVKFSLCDFNPKDLGMVYIYTHVFHQFSSPVCQEPEKIATSLDFHNHSPFPSKCPEKHVENKLVPWSIVFHCLWQLGFHGWQLAHLGRLQSLHSHRLSRLSRLMTWKRKRRKRSNRMFFYLMRQSDNMTKSMLRFNINKLYVHIIYIQYICLFVPMWNDGHITLHL